VEQFQAFWQRDTGIEREMLTNVEKASGGPHAIIISGLRRVGKSTLLAQVAHRLGEDQFYYINFEDDRFLGFRSEDADDLYQMLVEVFGDRKIFILMKFKKISAGSTSLRRFRIWG
jgi:predicted AAA+ superfamily ATPase